MTTLFTNDLKSGTRVQLRNGWRADIMDNKRGNIRLAKVYGYYEEIGSIYAHDIIAYYDTQLEDWQPVAYTPAQLKLRENVESMFA